MIELKCKPIAKGVTYVVITTARKENRDDLREVLNLVVREHGPIYQVTVHEGKDGLVHVIAFASLDIRDGIRNTVPHDYRVLPGEIEITALPFFQFVRLCLKADGPLVYIDDCLGLVVRTRAEPFDPEELRKI